LDTEGAGEKGVMVQAGVGRGGPHDGGKVTTLKNNWNTRGQEKRISVGYKGELVIESTISRGKIFDTGGWFRPIEVGRTRKATKKNQALPENSCDK